MPNNRRVTLTMSSGYGLDAETVNTLTTAQVSVSDIVALVMRSVPRKEILYTVEARLNEQIRRGLLSCREQ